METGKSRRRELELSEQETIISFNREEKVACIFTYEPTWQRHLEGRLGLKPVKDNGFGGREYELPKKMIKPPRAPRNLSAVARNKLTERLHASRVKVPQKLVPVGKLATGKQK